MGLCQSHDLHEDIKDLTVLEGSLSLRMKKS